MISAWAQKQGLKWAANGLWTGGILTVDGVIDAGIIISKMLKIGDGFNAAVKWFKVWIQDYWIVKKLTQSAYDKTKKHEEKHIQHVKQWHDKQEAELKKEFPTACKAYSEEELKKAAKEIREKLQKAWDKFIEAEERHEPFDDWVGPDGTLEIGVGGPI